MKDSFFQQTDWEIVHHFRMSISFQWIKEVTMFRLESLDSNIIPHAALVANNIEVRILES